jgi:hypothetical protein
MLFMCIYAELEQWLMYLLIIIINNITLLVLSNANNHITCTRVSVNNVYYVVYYLDCAVFQVQDFLRRDKKATK